MLASFSFFLSQAAVCRDIKGAHIIRKASRCPSFFFNSRRTAASFSFFFNQAAAPPDSVPSWTARMGFEKYCAAFGDYHCKCIAWVSGSSFFAKLYCEDLLWNHIGTDGQMPMFVLRFFKNGVGTWISLFEKQYDRPQRLALDVAALGLVESNNGGPGLAALPAGKMGEQPALGSASVLSSTEPNRTQFRAHNGTNNELAATHSFNS